MVVEIEMGHLATINHQRAIKKLVFGLEKLYQSGVIPYEPLPETDIDPGNPESKCPDLILQDNDNMTVPIIIEVSTRRGCKTDYAKLRRLMDETEFGIVEGFVLNFETGEWLKYFKGITEAQKLSSWSNTLNLDLSLLIV